MPSEPPQNPVRQLYQMYNKSDNKQEIIKNLAMQNPIIQQAMSMGSPKEMFYGLCRQKNVDPESILKQLM